MQPGSTRTKPHDDRTDRARGWLKHLWWLIPVLLVSGIVAALELFTAGAGNGQGYTLF